MADYADRPYGAHHRRVPNNGRFTNGEFEALCNDYGGKCLSCGATDKPLVPDHVVALSRGGSNTIDNIQPLCRECNASKQTNTIDYRGQNLLPITPSAAKRGIRKERITIEISLQARDLFGEVAARRTTLEGRKVTMREVVEAAAEDTYSDTFGLSGKGAEHVPDTATEHEGTQAGKETV